MYQLNRCFISFILYKIFYGNILYYIIHIYINVNSSVFTSDSRVGSGRIKSGYRTRLRFSMHITYFIFFSRILSMEMMLLYYCFPSSSDRGDRWQAFTRCDKRIRRMACGRKGVGGTGMAYRTLAWKTEGRLQSRCLHRDMGWRRRQKLFCQCHSGKKNFTCLI